MHTTSMHNTIAQKLTGQASRTTLAAKLDLTLETLFDGMFYTHQRACRWFLQDLRQSGLPSMRA